MRVNEARHLKGSDWKSRIHLLTVATHDDIPLSIADVGRLSGLGWSIANAAGVAARDLGGTRQHVVRGVQAAGVRQAAALLLAAETFPRLCRQLDGRLALRSVCQAVRAATLADRDGRDRWDELEHFTRQTGTGLSLLPCCWA